jgi:hypothetical protein
MYVTNILEDMQVAYAYTSYTSCYNMIMIISSYVTNHLNSSCNIGYNERFVTWCNLLEEQSI